MSNRYKYCKGCKINKITEKNKSGYCKTCKKKYYITTNPKAKIRVCNSCNETKIDSRNKKGICVKCISKNSIVNKLKNCLICGELNINYKCKKGVCLKCIRKKAIENKPKCSVCNTNFIQPENKSGMCQKCLYKNSKRPKCSVCDTNIGYENKSGMCMSCLKKDRQKYILRCSVCNLTPIRRKNKSGKCAECLKKETLSKKPRCSKCEVNIISENNKSGVCRECLRKKVKIVENKNKPKCIKCGIDILRHKKNGMCKFCGDGRRNKKNKTIEKRYCIECDKELPKSTKGNYCNEHRLIKIKTKPKKCANKDCNNIVDNPKHRKYCSTICSYDDRKNKKIEKLKKEGKYEEYLEKIENKYKPKIKICEKHNTKITSEMGCIKCSMEKQQLEEQKRIKNGWKKCGMCNSNWVMRTRTRCRSCIEKDFKRRKEKGLLN